MFGALALNGKSASLTERSEITEEQRFGRYAQGQNIFLRRDAGAQGKSKAKSNLCSGRAPAGADEKNKMTEDRWRDDKMTENTDSATKSVAN